MTLMKRRKGYYSISAVAKMFSVHQQTVRLYEKEGLISPKRSSGNTRLFSEEDVNRLEEIVHLTHQLGINLAGVEMIFKLKKQIFNMQKDMNKLFDNTQEELDAQVEQSKQAASDQAKQLLKIKRSVPALPKSTTTVESTKPSVVVDVMDHESMKEIDSWEIDYDE
jgi:MerR family transcriptional regulator/heat shock protein HspR